MRMPLLSEGSKVEIKSFKHNGKLHRVWENNIILSKTEDTFITINDQVVVTEADGSRWRTKEPAITYFSGTHWFNIVSVIRPKGIYFYCNLASPVHVAEGALHYIDYDLDVDMEAGGARRLLDQKEFHENSQLLGYPSEVKKSIEMNLEILYHWMDNSEGPFNKEFVPKWFKKYQQLDLKWDEHQ